MSLDTILALAAIAVTMTWTPGPNNVMLTASGANFGLWRTLPHAFGVAVGFPVMLFLVALGLGGVLQTFPLLAAALSWTGFIAMVWFSWKIASAPVSGQSHDGSARSKPLNLWQAAAFQWVNPKAWTFAIWIAASHAATSDALIVVAMAAVVFLISGLGSSVAWSAFGAVIGRVLGAGLRLRVFNLAMAAMLFGSAIWLTATR